MSDESLFEDRDMTRRAALLVAGAAGLAALSAGHAGAVDAVPLAKRLEIYGLQHLKESDLRTLEVGSGKTVVLDHQGAEKLGGHVTKLVPKTLHDVKRWVGVPDATIPKGRKAYTAVPASFLPRLPPDPAKHPGTPVRPAHELPRGPAEPTRAQAEAIKRHATLVAHHTEFAKHALPYYNFMFHNSAAVSPDSIKLIGDLYLKYMTVWTLTFADIHVASGAQLVLAHSVDVLFARHIQIDTGGKIVVRGITHARIDCAGINGGPKRDKIIGGPIK
jgi:hypothetical protein